MAAPAQLKAVQHHLRTAQEHEKRDPVVAYYCRLYAMQTGMKLDSKTPECRKFLVKLMDQLESMKTELSDDDSITQEVVGNAHIENYALKMFLYADNEDRAGRFHKNMIKSFYTASLLLDVLSVFGELSEENIQHRKYARWKAAYIHNCLKSGETPEAGPIGMDLDQEAGAQPPSQTHGVPSRARRDASTLARSLAGVKVGEVARGQRSATQPLPLPPQVTCASRPKTSPRPRSTASTPAAPCSTRTCPRPSTTSRRPSSCSPPEKNDAFVRPAPVSPRHLIGFDGDGGSTMGACVRPLPVSMTKSRRTGLPATGGAALLSFCQRARALSHCATSATARALVVLLPS
uniref:Vesicle (multivesicular body) trafficking 1 n=1 Tax=Hippocampus comes TaxID=109280 RepID=A0A3Q2XQT3_HIPCM